MFDTNSRIGNENATISLSDLYNAHFDVVRVSSDQLLDAVHRLRYQVYCVENAFEDPAEHPDGREIDSLDWRSVHAALIHRPTDRVVGTVRIVLPDPEVGAGSLPIMELTDTQVREQLSAYAKHGLAEVSRYAVTKLFRHGGTDPDDNGSVSPVSGNGDPQAPVDLNWASAERRLMPYITLGLIRAAIALCREQNVAYMGAVMEPTLLRLLKRFGIRFQPLGPLVEHHGLRQPCIIAIDDMEQGVVERSNDFGETVRGPLKPELMAAE